MHPPFPNPQQTKVIVPLERGRSPQIQPMQHISASIDPLELRTHSHSHYRSHRYARSHKARKPKVFFCEAIVSSVGHVSACPRNDNVFGFRYMLKIDGMSFARQRLLWTQVHSILKHMFLSGGMGMVLSQRRHTAYFFENLS